ncbi:MAG: CbtB domain-containing protein [Solirubrobacteraceae bacterium]
MSEVLVERGAVAGPIATPRELLPYAIFAGVLTALLVYFVGAEEGATSLVGGSSVHELLHDGRHLLCFPCH